MPPASLLPLPPGAADRLLAGSRVAAVLQFDRGGALVGLNRRAEELLGLEGGRRPVLEEVVVAHTVSRLREGLRAGSLPEEMLVDFLDATRHPFTLRCRFHVDGDVVHVLAEPHQEGDEALSRTLVSVNQELAVLSRENARRARELSQAKEALERAHEELRATHWHLKKVQEVISVCMTCGSVNAVEDVWQSMSAYFKDNAIFLSHGLCPSCARAMEEQLEEEMDDTSYREDATS